MERSLGREKIGLGSLVPLNEKPHWRPHWKVEKFLGDYPEMTAEDLKAAGIEPYETLEFDGNCLLNSGINSIIWPLVAGSGGTAMNSTNSYIGVGDSSTAASASQTGLQAATNKTWQQVSGAPTVGSNQQIVFSATFGSASANYAWNEICVGNGSNPPSTGVTLNRLVQTMGTKASGTSWVATLTITLS